RGQIDRAVRAVIEDRITAAEADAHLPALRQRRDELATAIAALGAPPRVLPQRPPGVDAYLVSLERLAATLNANLAAGIDAAAVAIRAMIETVTVMPADRGQAPEIIVRGDLGFLFAPAGLQHGGETGSGGRI
ncbi:MAG TPA: hypothetical protein VMR17_12905, partial [Xanthobacteraceae bacterium]|nr:hypothetical protein [Xanthobacteraceae bacterium]